VAKYEDLRSEEDWLLAVTGRAWAFGDFITQAQLLANDQLTAPPPA
jgi:hypothetical protein